MNISEILRMVVPNVFSTAAETGLFALVALMMGTIGINFIAYHHVAINLAAITLRFP